MGRDYSEKSTNKLYTVNSFFSGIGGFDLAFEQSGFKSNFYCENDTFCRSVLKRHWPNLNNWPDIRTIDSNKIPNAIVWSAGFPCQDLSLAKAPHGRPGFRGNQSSLFFVFHELVKIHSPKVVIIENVVGLLNSHKGKDFALLLEGLTELGYAVAWRVLNARYFGIPQSRARVFLVAWKEDPSSAVSTLFEEELAPIPKREREGFLIPSLCNITGAMVPKISYCISATSARHTGLDWARSYVSFKNRVRRLTPLETERLQGLPDRWTLPSDEYIIPINGIDTERYRAVGNAVAIPVVKWIAKRMKLQLEFTEKYRRNNKSTTSNKFYNKNLEDLSREFKVNNIIRHSLRSKRTDLKWQRGGCAYGDTVVHAQVSTAPVNPIITDFVDIIEKREVPERYFLSPNAARGILMRVEKMGRSLFEPLEASLRNLAYGSIEEDIQKSLNGEKEILRTKEA